MENLTPLMQQYHQIKNKYKDSILFYRIGDFYETFNDDAKVASKILEITLTSKEAGKGERIPLAGVPYHAAQSYIARLIKEGYKVAICEQTEDPKFAKGVVKREVTRVITPGTVLESGILSERINNFLLAVSFSRDALGVAFMDISTGEFQCTEFRDEKRLNSLLNEISRLNPAECILPESERDGFAKKLQRDFPNLFVTYLPIWEFESLNAFEKLKTHFKTNSLKGFGIEDEWSEAISGAGALLTYVEANQKTNLNQVCSLKLYTLDEYMVLDSATQKNLDIIENQITKAKKGSLLETIDKTVTAMGARKLRFWITHPLIKIGSVNERLDVVDELVKNIFERDRLQEDCKKISDIERITARLNNIAIINPREILSLKHSLKTITLLPEKLGKFSSDLLQKINLEIKQNTGVMENIIEIIENSINENAPFSVKESGIIKKGFNKELDELNGIVSSGKDWVISFESKERERTKIKSLKVRFNQIFGYYIDVSRPNLSQVPVDYTRKQTLANSERFVTPELKDYESKIMGAEEKISHLEMEIFKGICESIAAHTAVLQVIANRIAELDVLIGLSISAYLNNYVRPLITEEKKIEIKKGRHPVVEKIMSNEFVPNDTFLDSGAEQILIITGPNMAGKSTYIRQVALITLMAQIGSFVPAESAEIGLVDRIFTRIGAMDNLARGESTFLVEMNETANILNNVTDRSLIILDEIGRGTSTYDGLSIAWAVVEYLHSVERVRARTLFATHYHELIDLSSSLDRVKNYNVAVREWNDEVIFLHQIVPGGADKSYGIHVAQLAGLPKDVIKRAREILSNLEEDIKNSSQFTVDSSQNEESKKDEQLSLFSNTNRLLTDKIKNLDIKNMTPIEALNFLASIQKELKNNQ